MGFSEDERIRRKNRVYDNSYTSRENQKQMEEKKYLKIQVDNTSDTDIVNALIKAGYNVDLLPGRNIRIISFNLRS